MFDRSCPPQESRPQPTSAPFGTFEYSGNFDYPSPAATSFDTSCYSGASYPSFATTQSMPPPSSYPTSGNRQHTESMDTLADHHQGCYSTGSPATSDQYSPPAGPHPQPYSPFGLPLTPNSSIGVDELPVRPTSGHTSSTHLPVDLRRLSVQSLLSGPPGDGTQQGRQYPIGDNEYTVYGYDVGLPDLDIPQNDDINAIAIFSPPSGAIEIDGDSRPSNTETRGKDMAFEKGGYYAKPVPIKIPKSLEPLPSVSGNITVVDAHINLESSYFLRIL